MCLSQKKKCWHFFLISPQKHILRVLIKNVSLMHFLKSTHNIYSWLSLSRTRLSRITAYLEVKILSLPKHENLTTSKKYCGKEEKLLLRINFSSFPQYFLCISNFKSAIIYMNLLNVVVRITFSSILKIWDVEVRISRSVSESPLEFEITRVDCILWKNNYLVHPLIWSYVHIQKYDIYMLCFPL